MFKKTFVLFFVSNMGVLKFQLLAFCEGCLNRILYQIPNGQNPEWTKSRMDKIQNQINFKDRESQD